MEVAAGHPLFGRRVTVLGQSLQADDVLLATDGGWAIVHLTWSRRAEPPDLPHTRLFDNAASVQRVIDIEFAEWRADWETYDRLTYTPD